MSMPRSGMAAFLAALGVLGGVTAATAAAGGLDQTFGSGGIVTAGYDGPFPAVTSPSSRTARSWWRAGQRLRQEVPRTERAGPL